MNKLSIDFQKQFSDRLIFDKSVFARIDHSVKLHEETNRNPLSSSAACLNVIGALSNDPKGLMSYLNSFNLQLEEILPFPAPAEVDGRLYNDTGYAVFEWVGPQTSPLLEIGGGRGQNRTSIDAYVLGKIAGKICQIFIEWKFTEGSSREVFFGKFSGGKGIERLRRYSTVLAGLRKRNALPFAFSEEFQPGQPASALSLADFSPDHLYQLMRMTLLAKTTTPIMVGDLSVSDYRILHLSHSANDKINRLYPKYLELSPGLSRFADMDFHTVWRELLAEEEKSKFLSGYWDQSIPAIENEELRNYLTSRYFVERFS